MTAKLTRAQVELVLKRAAELEASQDDREDDAIAAAEVERLGQEAGLSPRALSQAMAEWRRGHMSPVSSHITERLLGDPHVEVSRWVPESAAAVERALAEFMREQLMVPDRDHGERIEWIRAPGLFAGLGRSLTFASRYSFGPASRVESLVVEEEGGCFVNFRIELGAARKLGVTALAWRAVALSGFALLMAQGLGDVQGLLGWLGGSGAGVSAFWWAERQRFAQLRARAAQGPERFLAALSRPRVRSPHSAEGQPTHQIG